MTDQQQLSRLLDAFLVEGTNELADRVIDAALDEIDDTHQRRVLRTPRRFSTMTMPLRLATAAVIGVLAVGTIYLVGRGPTGPGSPSQTPGVTTGASQTPGPSASGSPQLKGSWTITGAMLRDHDAHTATLLPDGRVLVASSDNATDPASAELYDPITGTWTATGPMNHGRFEYTATLLRDGRVLAVGDYNAASKTAEIYDPSTGTWSLTGELAHGRTDHTATLLPDGRVLVAGGSDDADIQGEPSALWSELYDPATGLWTRTGDMNVARRFATATLLPDGTVLVAGPDNTAELYDPRTGLWTPTAPMIADHAEHTATLLPDGTVLLAGGYGPVTDVLSELYDPRTGTWTATGPMVESFTRHTATLLPDGTVLVAGGQSNTYVEGLDPALAFAELYDPASRTWTALAEMNFARRYHAATLLLDGKVLVTGGIGPGAGSSAELYDPLGGD